MARSIVVVGGGVIGLCCAVALRRRGAEVAVLDGGPRERAASHVNAGWIVPTLAEPVPGPGLAAQSAKWMLRTDSPLYIAPRPDPAFIRWVVDFWRHCTAPAARAGTEATAALGERTFALYDDLRAAGVRFEQHEDGLLYAFRDERALHHDHAALSAILPPGYDAAPVLGGDEARALEPSLSDAVAGGFWLKRERSVRPDSLVTGLREWLAENGAAVRDGERVVGFGGRGAVESVVSDRASYAADAVVVAAGAWTAQLLSPLGVRLPLQGGKGYSIDFAPPPPLPEPIRHPLYLHDERVAITPMEGMLRLAGTMELPGLDDRIRPERVNALVQRTGEVIRGWPARVDTAGPGVRVWHGPRPMTPDGLPAIGFAPGWRNLAVATGHAMMGVTLAPATGEAVADLVDGRAPEVLRPFALERFA